jgi:hypothetical protein
MHIKFEYIEIDDRLCSLMARVPDYTSRGLGFDFRRYQIFGELVGLERDSLSLVRITEDEFGRNISGIGL